MWLVYRLNFHNSVKTQNNGWKLGFMELPRDIAVIRGIAWGLRIGRLLKPNADRLLTRAWDDSRIFCPRQEYI